MVHGRKQKEDSPPSHLFAGNILSTKQNIEIVFLGCDHGVSVYEGSWPWEMR